MLKMKKLTKKEVLKGIFDTLIVILGSFLVSFGNVAFLSPLDVNAGGLNGIAIIIRFFIDDAYKVLVYNISIATLSVVLWSLGLIFIGKDFALKTLVATIAFPVANALFTACPGVTDLISRLAELIKGNESAGDFLLSGIFGGVFVGAGVGITFVGGGSTGGVDVLTFLAEKFLHIKQSIASFAVDGTIIVVGLCILVPSDNKLLLPCLSGILSAFVSAVLIDYIYIGSQRSYQADIISDKWEEISRFAQDELDRGTTIIPAEGGYKNEERIILRVVFDRRQLGKLKSFIAKVDKHAFVTYTRTNAVYGEGFRSHDTQESIFNKKNGNKQ